MINKQEAIEKLQSEAVNHYSETSGWFKEIKLDIVTDIVNQINEPEKPIVPQFVADWLEVCKENLALSLAIAMNPNVLRTNNQSEKTINWFKSPKNQETFANAWLFGYEIEKEKLYTVELPNPNGDGYSKLYLSKNKDGKVELFQWSGYTSIDFADDWKLLKNAQLTEDEIKEDFDWAWQFAEEVEE